MLFESFGSWSSRGWFHSCSWSQWDRAPGVLRLCRAAKGAAASVNHHLLSPWAGTELHCRVFAFSLQQPKGLLEYSKTCTPTMSLNFSKMSSFCHEIHLTLNVSPISVLKKSAGMVGEIICNLLLVFRNQSRLDVSFGKTICICGFNSTKEKSHRMEREKKHERVREEDWKSLMWRTDKRSSQATQAYKESWEKV